MAKKALKNKKTSGMELNEEKKNVEKKPLKNKKEDLPQFPPKNTKTGEFSESPGGSNEVETDDVVLEEICSDLIAVPFEIWHLLKPVVPELTSKERTLIGKPLARVAQKYDVQKYMKDEILLVGFLGFSIIRRVKIGKKHDTNDNREKGPRQDNTIKGNNPGESS